MAENGSHAPVASRADFMQQHAVLIKRGAAGGSAVSGEECGAGRSARLTTAAAGELVAGRDRPAVMVRFPSQSSA